MMGRYYQETIIIDHNFSGGSQAKIGGAMQKEGLGKVASWALE